MTKHFVLSLAVVTMTALSATAQTVAPAQPGRPAQQPGQVVQPGQQPAQPGLQPGQPGLQPRQAAVAGQPGNLDQAIAACLALGNQEEIALAQLAASRAKNDRVKEFAQTMQREHTAALQKLQRAAPQLASLNLELQAGGGATGRPGTPGQATGVQQAGAPQQFGQQGVQQATSTQPAGADSQVIALQRAIAQQCLALTQRELDEAGENFDECYIGQQVGAHVGMLAKLQASEQFASGQLRSFIQEATPTVERHLQHAKELAKELKGASASASARTNPAATR